MLSSQMLINPFEYKALSLIDGCIFIEFMHTLKGVASVQTTKPVQEPKLGSSLAVPVGNPNENPNFNQVVPGLVQGNALKAFWFRLFHVLYQNVVIIMALIRKLDRCLTPPPQTREGGVCFCTP